MNSSMLRAMPGRRRVSPALSRVSSRRRRAMRTGFQKRVTASDLVEMGLVPAEVDALHCDRHLGSATHRRRERAVARRHTIVGRSLFDQTQELQQIRSVPLCHFCDV